MPEKFSRYYKETGWSPLDTTIVGTFGMGFALPMGSHKNKIHPNARAFVEMIFAEGAGAGGDHRNGTAAQIQWCSKENQNDTTMK